MKESQVYISVRSKDRTFHDNTTSSQYKVLLPRMFHNVIKIEYINAEIPNTVFSANSRQFIFSCNVTDATTPTLVSSLVCVVPVLPGIWEDDDLMNFMTNNIFVQSTYGITNLRISGIFTFGVDSSTNKLYVQPTNSSLVSQFKVLSGTDTSFGFINDSIIPLSLSGKYYGTYPMTFSAPNFLFLCVDELLDFEPSNVLTPISNKVPVNKILARLQLNADVLHWVVQSPNVQDFVRKTRSGHYVNFHTLSISFLDPFGNVVDFQGVEHTLLLRVTYKE